MKGGSWVVIAKMKYITPIVYHIKKSSEALGELF